MKLKFTRLLLESELSKVIDTVTIKSPDDVTRIFAEHLNNKEDMFELPFLLTIDKSKCIVSG